MKLITHPWLTLAWKSKFVPVFSSSSRMRNMDMDTFFIGWSWCYCNGTLNFRGITGVPYQMGMRIALLVISHKWSAIMLINERQFDALLLWRQTISQSVRSSDITTEERKDCVRSMMNECQNMEASLQFEIESSQDEMIHPMNTNRNWFAWFEDYLILQCLWVYWSDDRIQDHSGHERIWRSMQSFLHCQHFTRNILGRKSGRA